MDDARFWSVVASLGPELVPGRLAMVLNSLTPTDLHEFCVCLDHVEAELDTPAHRAQADVAYEVGPQVDGAGDIQRSWTTSDDPRHAEFSELQVTVVAHGRDTWNAVVAVPPLLSGGWPTGLGRQFLLAVSNALRRSLRSVQPA